MKKIGVIGRGFVGSAVEFGFSAQCGCSAQLKSFDIDPKKSKDSLEETVNQSDFIFLSVPTPSNSNGIDISYLINALENIKNVNKRTDNIILIRSTIIPGTTKKLQSQFSNLNIVFNPEFLTQRSAKYDFINQSRFVLGGKDLYTNKVAELYRWRFGKTIRVILTNYETAEMIKYMNNCFFSTKVAFMNEMKLVADKCGADWERAVEGFSLDGRIGNSHLSVPGHDGKKGFGGSCLPKDIRAMIFYGKKLNLNLNTLNGAWKTNLKVRPEKDWEMLIGRSVVRKK